MVLYVLRHEQRPSNKCDYFTNLSKIGSHKSRVILFQKLSNLEIDEIYCSPYKRTLDTIQYSSMALNTKIKIDWALADRLSEQDALKYDCYPNKEVQENLHKLYNIDLNYVPTTNIDYITSYVESDDDFEKRVDNFLNFITINIDKNILLVTHGLVCNRIIKKLTGINKNIKMGQCYKLDVVDI